MNTLVLFARWPEPGRVKTRLSPALPPALACALHRAMLDDALWSSLSARADRRVVAWAEAPAFSMGTPVPGGFEQAAQRGADLGARLAAAFAEQLTGPGERVVVIGSDCPELSASDLDAAFDALGTCDLAVGPSRDGGFWLVGLSRPAPQVFDGVAWSTDRALSGMLGNAAAAGLSVARLATRADVDTPADLVRLIAALARPPARARFTRGSLSAMGLLPAA